jgi:hypothetical protein
VFGQASGIPEEVARYSTLGVFIAGAVGVARLLFTFQRGIVTQYLAEIERLRTRIDEVEAEVAGWERRYNSLIVALADEGIAVPARFTFSPDDDR